MPFPYALGTCNDKLQMLWEGSLEFEPKVMIKKNTKENLMLGWWRENIMLKLGYNIAWPDKL